MIAVQVMPTRTTGPYRKTGACERGGGKVFGKKGTKNAWGKEAFRKRLSRLRKTFKEEIQRSAG